MLQQHLHDYQTLDGVLDAVFQVLKQMTNDLRKETEACLQEKPAGRKGTGAQGADKKAPADQAEAASSSDDATGCLLPGCTLPCLPIP